MQTCGGLKNMTLKMIKNITLKMWRNVCRIIKLKIVTKLESLLSNADTMNSRSRNEMAYYIYNCAII